MVTSQPSITNCPKLLRENGFHILFVMLCYIIGLLKDMKAKPDSEGNDEEGKKGE